MTRLVHVCLLGFAFGVLGYLVAVPLLGVFDPGEAAGCAGVVAMYVGVTAFTALRERDYRRAKAPPEMPRAFLKS